MLAAPRCWFCALACKAMVPSKSTAAVKVIVTFRTRPSFCSQGAALRKAPLATVRPFHALFDDMESVPPADSSSWRENGVTQG
jgi:hypothetical protein